MLPYGPTNDGWLMDDGVSGSLLDDRCFATFLEDIEAKRVRPDFVVVYSFSRICRVDSFSNSLAKRKASEGAAAQIKAVLGFFKISILDDEGAIQPGSIVYNAKSMIAQADYSYIQERTRDGKARNLGLGSYCRGGRPPFGYRVIGDRKGRTLEADPVDAPNLLRLLDWFIEGGLRFAARRATEEGIPTPMRTTTKRKNQAPDWTPTRWSEVSVQHIVKNIGAYLGSTTLEFDGEPYPLTYPALIDSELHARVLTRRQERTVKERTEFLSTGFVDCACGEHVHQKNTHNNYFTRCPAGCGSMPQRKFEAYLWTAVVCRLIQIRRHEGARSAERDYSAEITKFKSEIESVNKSISALLDLYMEGLDKETWRTRNEALNQKKALHQADLDRVQKQIENQKHKRVTEQTLEQQLRSIIDELYSNEPAPTRKREVLARLLNGGRVGVQFDVPVPVLRKDGEPHKGAYTSPGLTITLPAFGGLPPVSIDTKREIQPQLLGRGSIAGKTMISSHIGQPLEEIELQLLQKLQSVGGRVVSRKKLPDGSVEIIKTADKYPW